MSDLARRKSGSTLIVALMALMIVGALIGVAVNLTSSTARIANRSHELAALQAGAEGALEQGFAIWNGRLAQKSGAITTSEASSDLNPPHFPGMTYTIPLAVSATDAYGAPTTDPTPIQIDVPNYPGWRGLSYNYQARVELASDALGGPLRYGIERHFTYTEVPMFQAMFFYEDDIELYKPAPMMISGLVHTNRWGYAPTICQTSPAPAAETRSPFRAMSRML